jgi:uncharacterized membrane protein YedE/YeeE
MSRQMLVAFVAGLLFAIGLGVAGMANPDKVLAFLDLFGGEWDPSLMLVMVGAIAIYAPVYRLLNARGIPWLDDRIHLPEFTAVDGKLLIGSILFGIGWGLSGLCPGPTVVALVTGSPPLLMFAAAMLVGMLAHAAMTRSRPTEPISSLERERDLG